MDNNQKTIELSLFYKTGGSQPTDLTTSNVNRYFVSNYAKVWAMQEGFISYFKGLDEFTIKFDLITDPRIPTNLYYISLCNFIAKTYKENVTQLKDITNFEVNHFIASDIIGFNVNENEIEKQNEYSKRMKQAYDTLPKEPKSIHFGKIK